MKRGGLFLIGLASAVVTVITLHATVGNRFNSYGYGPWNRYHHCYGGKYDDRFRDRDERRYDLRKDSLRNY